MKLKPWGQKNSITLLLLLFLDKTSVVLRRRQFTKKCDSRGILWLAEVQDRDGSVPKHNLVCLEMGFRQPSIMHGCVAEIIHKDYLTPEGGVLQYLHSPK